MTRYFRCLALASVILLIRTIPASAQTAVRQQARQGRTPSAQPPNRSSQPKQPQQLYPKKEYAATLLELTHALLKRQMADTHDHNYGGIWCARCHVWHTRAAESVYPFTVAYGITADQRYLSAAELAASWLIRQQQANGSWKETPEEWTGTTTDQLLMMLLSYEKIGGKLDTALQSSWRLSMQKAAAWLNAAMTPEFASINYVATTTATLATAGIFFHNDKYLEKAAALAHRVISKMDEDGFLNGEGGRSHGNKMGVDMGYDMEMSLWGLALYARLTHDTLVHNYVAHALNNHLFFIYPDGSLDASWGIRSNKWTGYGSATSDGSQVLFTLFADEDPRYTTAALRNLGFLRQNKHGDLIGYGPQSAEIYDSLPCIYPTFAKAKNLAMAYELETRDQRIAAPLPSDSLRWTRTFPTIDVIEVRTKNIMATITAYRYKDPAGAKGKYMYRPTGGSISHCWLNGQGFLTASSPTVYTRPEPMSFPEAPGVLPLTPRIEYTDTAGYFTNLFEYDARIQTSRLPQNRFAINVTGELKDKDFLAGGVGYKMSYTFADSSISHTVRLTWHDARPQTITIIEPVIQYSGTTFEKIDDHNVLITSASRQLKFTLVAGEATLVAGRNAEHYWTPYPALKAFPVMLDIHPPANGFTSEVIYRISIIR